MAATIVCAVLLQRALVAQAPPEPLGDWDNVLTLRGGQSVSVETFQPRQRLKGRLVDGNVAAITIRTAKGEQTVARANVSKVTTLRSIRTALIIGAGSGAGVYAIMAPKGDFNALGHLIFGGAFVGIGVLFGWAIGSAGRSLVIYEAPTPVSTPPRSGPDGQ